MTVRLIRLTGIAVILTALWYVPWLVTHTNPDALWFAIPFVAANLLLVLATVISIINRWQRSEPADMLTLPGTEPLVAVALTTAGEATAQVRATARSLLVQQWPIDRLWVIVSDDAHDDEMRAMVERLAADHPDARLTYHRPPPRGTDERHGEAKAGNLNSVLELVRAAPQPIDFLETRDADDEVGDPLFLSRCIAQLRSDEGLAYVQTIKDARVSVGDPFDNRQPHFYRAAMSSRHAANAVFPCGSGLVWRLAAVEDIGGFPAWNLVEDLQSGVEALRRGWRGAFLPIVGALGQHAPEDIPNAYKQRGTWALDTTRLLLWRSLSGLNIRQRLQFAELGLFYVQGLTTLIFIVSPTIGFIWELYPLRTDLGGYLLHFWPFAIGLEILLALFNRPNSYESLWRARQMWVGLAPVYSKAVLLAVAGGPNRKPAYRVTRKSDAFAWYWRETAPQALLLLLICGSIVYGAATSAVLTSFDLGSAYWTVLYAVLLTGFLRKSWFGSHSPFQLLRRRLSRARWLLPATMAMAGAAALVAAVAALESHGAITATTVDLGLLAAAAGACALALTTRPRLQGSVAAVAAGNTAATAAFVAAAVLVAS